MNPPIDLQSRPRLAANVRLQADTQSGEPVLLFPEGMLELNPTAHAIVAACDEAESVAQIIAALAEEYEADPAELRDDVCECLRELAERRFIEFQP